MSDPPALPTATGPNATASSTGGQHHQTAVNDSGEGTTTPVHIADGSPKPHSARLFKPAHDDDTLLESHSDASDRPLPPHGCIRDQSDSSDGSSELPHDEAHRSSAIKVKHWLEDPSVEHETAAPPTHPAQLDRAVSPSFSTVSTVPPHYPHSHGAHQQHFGQRSRGQSAPLADLRALICPKEKWVPNSASLVCPTCKNPFSVWRRRHHCRSCGNLVCYQCSLTHTVTKALTCIGCAPKVTAAAFDLLQFPFFHGCLPHHHAAQRLEETYLRNGYILFVAADEFYVPTLAFKSEEKVSTIPIRFESGKGFMIATSKGKTLHAQSIPALISALDEALPWTDLEPCPVPQAPRDPNNHPCCPVCSSPCRKPVCSCGCRVHGPPVDSFALKADEQTAMVPHHRLETTAEDELSSHARPHQQQDAARDARIAAARMSKGRSLVQDDGDGSNAGEIAVPGKENSAILAGTLRADNHHGVAIGTEGADEEHAANEATGHTVAQATPPRPRDEAHELQALSREPSNTLSLVHESMQADPRSQLLSRFLVHSASIRHIRSLKKGSLSRMSLCRFNNTDVVVKEARKPKSSPFILHEVIALATLSHPNIIHLVGVSIDTPFPMAVLENCPMRDLSTFLHHNVRESNRKRARGEFLRIVRGVCAGLVYLCDTMGMAHGGIASRNILLTEELVPKVSDFKLAAWSGAPHLQGSERYVNPRWASPERNKSPDLPPTHASDVWSYGVLLYEVYSWGMLPYPEKQNLQNLRECIIRGEVSLAPPADMPVAIAHIMQTNCLRECPEERATFSVIMTLLSLPDLEEVSSPLPS